MSHSVSDIFGLGNNGYCAVKSPLGLSTALYQIPQCLQQFCYQLKGPFSTLTTPTSPLSWGHNLGGIMTRNYTQAVAELTAIVDWLKASNGEFLYLRHSDCQRFIERSTSGLLSAKVKAIP